MPHSVQKLSANQRPMSRSSLEAADALQKLLSQALRESMKELAKSAAGPEEVDGHTQSIDSIIRNVTARVMEKEGPGVAAVAASAEVKPVAEAPPEPLLVDLQATAWAMWRENDDVHGLRRAISPDSFRPPREEACGWVSEPLVHLAPRSPLVAGRTLPAEGDSDTSRRPSSEADQGDHAAFDDGAAPEDVAARPSSAEVRHPSAGNGSSFEDEASTQLTQPVHVQALGEQPLLVRGGLTMQTHTALHLVMRWQVRPRNVLVVAKKGDEAVMQKVQDINAWLSSQGMTVVVEQQLLQDPHLRSSLQGVRTFSKGDDLGKCIDLVITLGGDGTLTWAVSLFRGAMPPVLSFAAGSLGFLTPFPLDGWVRTLAPLMNSNKGRCQLPLVCRMRLKVVVCRKNPEHNTIDRSFLCLNEVLVHRGQSGALAKLEVKVDGEHVTLVQGDGLILATPTGSTAYSLAAGGSMVHPSVPGILLTPVSPHSLSFRPALLPDSSVVAVGVPLNARGAAALSVDGKDVCTLRPGDSVQVSMSRHPVPTICRNTETVDWFTSVHEALQWNRRAEQKAH